MSRASSPEPQPRRRSRLGCLGRILLAIGLAVVLVIAVGLIFDQGDDAGQPERGFNVGPAESFETADVNYIEPRHLFVVRLQDGSFTALYDQSPKQQELGSGCRVFFDDNAALGPEIEQLPGFRGAFVEECEGTRAVWRADGQRAFGAGYGNLDRYQTSTDAAGNLIVDISSRTCTRSKGGVPPFVETTC